MLGLINYINPSLLSQITNLMHFITIVGNAKSFHSLKETRLQSQMLYKKLLNRLLYSVGPFPNSLSFWDNW